MNEYPEYEDPFYDPSVYSNILPDNGTDEDPAVVIGAEGQQSSDFGLFPAEQPPLVVKYTGPVNAIAETSPPAPADLPTDTRQEAAEHTEIANCENAPQDVVRLYFIECEHHPGNALNIARALEDSGCKTVVFEHVTNPQTRQQIQDAMDTMIDPAADLHARQRATDVLWKKHYGYVAQTLGHLQGKVERARLFDISRDHPAAADTKAMLDTYEASSHAIRSHAPNDELRSMEEIIIRLDAHTKPQREQHMSEQLIEYSKDEVPLGPHTMGVVTGYEHGGTRLRMSAADYQCEATTVTSGPSYALYLASPTGQITEQLIADPNAAIDPKLLDRAIVDKYLNRFGFDAAQACEFATGADDETITSLMDRLERLKRSGRDPEDITKNIDKFLTRTMQRRQLANRLRDIIGRR